VPLSYASPNLRLALLKEDHPDAEHEFSCVPIDHEIDGKPLVPPPFRGSIKWLVLCRLTIPGMADVVAFKEVSTEGKNKRFSMDPNFQVVCETRALGRALKRAGYPDDMADFRALVLWRQRNKEVLAIGSGLVPAGYAGALGAGPTPVDPLAKALDDAGAAGAKDADDDIADAELVDELTPEQAARARYNEIRDLMDGPERARFSSWARHEHKIGNVANPKGDDDIAKLLAALERAVADHVAPWNPTDDDPDTATAPTPFDQKAADDAADQLFQAQAAGLPT
jgi:hypothetical protein